MAKIITPKQYAEIVNDVVENVIMWDGQSEYISENVVVLIPATSKAGIGWGYVDGKFIKPVEEPVTLPEEIIEPTPEA